MGQLRNIGPNRSRLEAAGRRRQVPAGRARSESVPRRPGYSVTTPAGAALVPAVSWPSQGVMHAYAPQDQDPFDLRAQAWLFA